MANKLSGILFCLCALSWQTTDLIHAFETGGTNFVLYETASESVAPINGWITDDMTGSAKHALGAYDRNPSLVRSKLQEMCNAGQKKISLVLSFFAYDTAWNLTETQKSLTYQTTGGEPPAVQAIYGEPTSRITKNIQDFMQMAKSLTLPDNTPCFNEFQFRFSAGGSAHPASWSSWDEYMYQQNWNFIVAIRNTVKNSLGNTQTYFDLGLEMGGYEHGQNSAYIKRLITDYNAQFGVSDTYGFSIAWVAGRLQTLIATYDQAGIRPPQHAIDIYEEPGAPPMIQQLQDYYNELKQTGEQNKPIIIQETYYNDSKANDTFTWARESLGLNIRTIMQWPMARGDLTSFTLGTSYAYFNTTSTNPSILGDLNGDGHVNILDYNLLVAGYGTTYTIFDYNDLVANYGK